MPNFVSFAASIAEIAHGEKSHNQSITHWTTHPAYLMPREWSACASEKSFCSCMYSKLFMYQLLVPVQHFITSCSNDTCRNTSHLRNTCYVCIQLALHSHTVRQSATVSEATVNVQHYFTLTPSTPVVVPNCCCSNGPAPYWSKPPFLIFTAWAYARAVLEVVILSVCPSVRMSVCHTRALWQN